MEPFQNGATTPKGMNLQVFHLRIAQFQNHAYFKQVYAGH